MLSCRGRWQRERLSRSRAQQGSCNARCVQAGRSRGARAPLRRRRLLVLKSPGRLLRGLCRGALCLRIHEHVRSRVALGHAVRAAATRTLLAHLGLVALARHLRLLKVASAHG
eukprot:scaffold104942_cov47-Phaeocystis_antarctica.AAC.1